MDRGFVFQMVNYVKDQFRSPDPQVSCYLFYFSIGNRVMKKKTSYLGFVEMTARSCGHFEMFHLESQICGAFL